MKAHKQITVPEYASRIPSIHPAPFKEAVENKLCRCQKVYCYSPMYDGTVYAIWKNPATDVENLVRPTLDINAPMYDILGRQVNTSYRGIIIQGGHKYLLR